MSTEEIHKAVREAGDSLWSAVHYTHSKLAYIADKHGLSEEARADIDEIHDELVEALGRYDAALGASK